MPTLRKMARMSPLMKKMRPGQMPTLGKMARMSPLMEKMKKMRSGQIPTLEEDGEDDEVLIVEQKVGSQSVSWMS